MTKSTTNANTEKLTQEQVTRYLQLTDRRLFIVMHSGASWKPEYAQELEAIDQELAKLCEIVDSMLDTHEEESNAELCQAVEKAQDYDFQALYDRWPAMSPVEVIAECREVLEIYDTLQKSPESVALDALGCDGFMQSMLFLESFCMRYLVDIFFSGQF